MTPAPLCCTLTDEVRRRAAPPARPVVALESTIISHGMPYPQNVAMAPRGRGHHPRRAARCRRPSRSSHGRPQIGLDADDLELLASHPDVDKVSVRDLPYVVARGGHGATTVAAHHAARGAGRDPRLRHRRPRRRAPRRRSRPSTSAPTSPSCPRTDVAVVSRRREEHPRHRPDPGDPRDPRRAGARRTAPTSSRRSTRAAAGTRPRCASTRRTRSPRVMRAKWDARPRRRRGRRQPDPGRRRDPRRPRSARSSTRPCRHGRPRHPRQGRDAVPPRPDRRDHRRREPRPPTSRWSATTPGSAPRSRREYAAE